MKSFRVLTTAAVLSLALASAAALHAETPGDKEQKELAAALRGAKVSLAEGLAAASKQGKPISAKFEVEDGKLQLSVYVANGKTFFEVIVDHVTGGIARSQAITGGDDLKHGTEQADAMSSAKMSLLEATGRAVKANAGYAAASVFPAIKEGNPTAEVTLTKGDERRVVVESLRERPVR